MRNKLQTVTSKKYFRIHFIQFTKRIVPHKYNIFVWRDYIDINVDNNLLFTNGTSKYTTKNKSKAIYK